MPDDDRDDGPCFACGGAVQWAPLHEGKTCGGLLVRGAWVCACGEARVGAATRPAEGAWTLAASGRSVETGTGRVRVDGGDVEGLCARIVRLPTLELIADLVRAGDMDAARGLVEEMDGAPTKPTPRQGELFGAAVAQAEALSDVAAGPALYGPGGRRAR